MPQKKPSKPASPKKTRKPASQKKTSKPTPKNKAGKTDQAEIWRNGAFVVRLGNDPQPAVIDWLPDDRSQLAKPVPITDENKDAAANLAKQFATRDKGAYVVRFGKDLQSGAIDWLPDDRTQPVKRMLFPEGIVADCDCSNCRDFLSCLICQLSCSL